MLCRKHLAFRQAEIAALRAVRPAPGQDDLSLADHPAWGCAEEEGV